MINHAMLKSCVTMTIDEKNLNPFDAVTFDINVPGIILGENYNIVPKIQIDLDIVDVILAVTKNDYVTVKMKNNSGNAITFNSTSYNIYKN